MRFYLVSNINNLIDFFSTGLFSPANFYTERDFGTSRYIKSKYDLSSDFITLYKVPPIELDYVDENNNERLVLIEVDLKKNDPYLIKKNNEIYLYSGSVYLETSNLKIMVTKELYNLIIKKARIVREIKLKNIRKSLSVSKHVNCNKLSLSEEVYEYSNILKDKIIVIDNYLNKLKGYYLLNIYFDETIFNKDPEEVENYLFINKCIEFINELKTYKNIRSKNKEIKFIKDIINKNNKIKLLKAKDKNLTIKSNGLMNFKMLNLSISEQKAFNVIINTLFKFSIGKKGNYTNDELYKLLVILKKNLLELDNDYNKDLEKVYLRLIKNDISISVEMIDSYIIQNLYLALLKYDNIEELKSMILKKNVQNSFIAVSFAGIIIGYADISRSISDKANNKYSSLILEKQIVYLKDNFDSKYILNIFDKEIFNKLNYLTKENNMHKLIWNLKKIQNVEITLKNYGTYLKMTLNNKYEIYFYTVEYKKLINEFINNNKRIGVRMYNSNSKYKYFRYLKFERSSKEKLNMYDKQELLCILNSLIK